MKSYIKGISECYGDYLCDTCRKRTFNVVRFDGKDYCAKCLDKEHKKAKQRILEENIRHQVCEEIRDYLGINKKTAILHTAYVINYCDLNVVLNQIEGENNE